MRYDSLTPDALQAEYEICLARYTECKGRGLSLNMARGKPNAEQLALSHAILHNLSPEDCFAEDGTDCRNYGGLDGLPEMKRLFAEILDVAPDEVLIGGNSSLAMMFDCIATLLLRDAHWRRGVTFICPSPGYDRHFSICEYFGIRMIAVDMMPGGPDMDAVERLAGDESVAGIWCVPVFSNPQGYVYTDETIERLAAMQTANPHFRIFWDNAYAVHHFRNQRPRIQSILRACERHGHADRPLLFTSFSKISFAGAAVACMAASDTSRAFFRERFAVQTVGPDKINQLRHVRYFKNIDGVLAHMAKQADVLRPKFELADTMLRNELSETALFEWYSPDGGYFLSVNTPPGCAKRTVSLCREAGVTLTDAGAAYPYKNDPQDRNIRLAPSFLTLDELREALAVFGVSAKLAALENIKRKAINQPGEGVHA